ncbi:MAG: DUF4430 domain-containing protein [Eubacteriales bacterium]|nr:DUF4430 domain-containing protein [Eubacteriales bacterium]
MKSKKTVIAFAILLILIAAMLFLKSTLSPKAEEGNKAITVIVNHLNGDQNTIKLKTDAEYLRGALEKKGLIGGTEQTYGLWVETVDGEKADASKEQWWGYDVNGEMAYYGVDEQPVNDGDTIEFTLNEGYDQF